LEPLRTAHTKVYHSFWKIITSYALQVWGEAGHPRTAGSAPATAVTSARSRKPGHLRILRDPAIDGRHAQPYGPGQRRQDRVDLAGELTRVCTGTRPRWPQARVSG
jgi:hypothetical protein